MGDLQFGAEALQLAADDARLADRQRLGQIVGVGIEEDQMEEPGHIAAAHLVGLLRIVRLHMSVDDHRHRDDAIRRRLGETCTGAAIHQPGRQVPAQ